MFLFNQLAEILNVRGHDGHAVCAGEMRYTARARRRCVGHHCDTDALEQVGNLIFRHVAGEPDVWTILASLGNRLQVSQSFRMIGPCDYQFDVRHLPGYHFERLHHGLEPFVGSPFAECQNPMTWIPALLECGILRPAAKNSMLPYIYRTPPVFIADQTAVGGQKNRDRIREQQQLRRYETGNFVQQPKTDSSILEVHRFHELMKRDVGIEPRQPRHRRNSNSRKCGQRLAAKTGKPKVEPDHIGLTFADGPQQPDRVSHAVERPATHNFEALKFRLGVREVVAENRDREARNGAQLAGDVKPVFVQRFSAWRKRGDQTDVHC